MDWGYPDQPPFTPLLARAASELFGDSLVGLRVASAVAAGVVVPLCGLIARELGGGRAAQVLAAGCMAVSAYLLAVGHPLSTSTFDLLAWAALSWAVVRALRAGGRAWVTVGVIGGLGLQIKTLPALLLAALLVGVLTVGPRGALGFRIRRGSGAWLACGIAAVLWAPNVVWQATHGWSLLTLSGAIAAGSSISGQPRWLFLPFQLVLVSPLLVPVWAAGLWWLAKDPEPQRYRAFWATCAVSSGVLVPSGKSNPKTRRGRRSPPNTPVRAMTQ
ncbi:MAG: glycosyltransferase family 39 protein [Pseudonocardia sp.]|nr:glycosyltransferase family 39 protein [Pseudonocardia sp.]